MNQMLVYCCCWFYYCTRNFADLLAAAGTSAAGASTAGTSAAGTSVASSSAVVTSAPGDGAAEEADGAGEEGVRLKVEARP